jgi:hypothetical protein
MLLFTVGKLKCLGFMVLEIHAYVHVEVQARSSVELHMQNCILLTTANDVAWTHAHIHVRTVLATPFENCPDI